MALWACCRDAAFDSHGSMGGIGRQTPNPPVESCAGLTAHRHAPARCHDIAAFQRSSVFK
jgi:hypothetical protein